MNHKFSHGIVLGIGIGLILSSSFFIFTNTKQNPELDSEFIIKEAEKLGMQKPEDFLKWENDGYLDYHENVENNEVEIDDSKDVIIVEIPKRVSSEGIAKILEENGLIDNEEDFTEIVNNSGVDSKLKWGVYEFNKDNTIEEIIEVLMAGSTY